LKKNSKKATVENLSSFVEDLIEFELKLLQTPVDLTRSMNLVDDMSLKNGPKRYNAFLAIYRMMSMLYPDNRPTMTELRRATSLSWSTAVRLMDFLVELGDCRRTDDTNDRRMVRIALTPSGRRHLRATKKYNELRSKEILSALSPEEQSVFIPLFSKVSKSLKKAKKVVNASSQENDNSVLS